MQALVKRNDEARSVTIRLHQATIHGDPCKHSACTVLVFSAKSDTLRQIFCSRVQSDGVSGPSPSQLAG
ncbi:hypothetical protein XAB3213_2500010 [Xanthomonas citri pv. bilvae]|nr:hypothetical protein XAB3213_2500010 [Xanthomonas citri pv. bilvae]